jgi:hypothetical protein
MWLGHEHKPEVLMNSIQILKGNMNYEEDWWHKFPFRKTKSARMFVTKRC